MVRLRMKLQKQPSNITRKNRNCSHGIVHIDVDIIHLTSWGQYIISYFRSSQDTDLEIYRYNLYGKNFIKTCNCSPDAYMQMVLQLTYFR